MIKNIFDELNIKGHLQIAKIFPDGKEEVVFDDHNIIVSGMGVGLSFLFTLSGSNKITDYQIDRCQIGVSGASVTETSAIYQLSSPLSSFNEYGGTAGGLVLVSATQIKNGVNVANQVFNLIPFHNVTRISNSAVRYTIFIDKDSCNNLSRGGADASINEIGLFMKNPRGDASTASILVAYRKFSNIRKTSDFALVFRWTINF